MECFDFLTHFANLTKMASGVVCASCPTTSPAASITLCDDATDKSNEREEGYKYPRDET